MANQKFSFQNSLTAESARVLHARESSHKWRDVNKRFIV